MHDRCLAWLIMLQLADVAWALATMRHHTQHLALLEEQAVGLLQQHLADAAATEPTGVGGGGSTSASVPVSPPGLSRLASLLWGLASLGHRPLQLLALLPAVLACQPALDSSGAGSDRKLGLKTLCSLGYSLAAASCAGHPAAAALAAALAAPAAGLPADAAKSVQLLQLHQFALALQQQAALGEQGGGQAQAPSAPAATAAAAVQVLQREPAMQQLLSRAAEAWQAEAAAPRSKSVSACQADVAATAVGGLGLAIHEEHSASGFSGGQPTPLPALAAPNTAAGDGGAASGSCLRKSTCRIRQASCPLPALPCLPASPDTTAPQHPTPDVPAALCFPYALAAVDIAVPSRQLAIEVDGPSHFCRNSPPSTSSTPASAPTAQPQLVPMGGTLLKRRLLQQAGWTVVSVGTAQWEQLRGAQQKRAFLGAAIAAATQGAAPAEAAATGAEQQS
jgi:hypothetical protein